MKRIFVIIAIGVAVCGAAKASGWSGLYGPVADNVETAQPAPEVQVRPADYRGVCVAAILEAQEQYGIPDNILLGIGLQEAGRTKDGTLTVWPWSVNAEGEGRYFANASEAEAWVRQKLAAGIRSIDVGCMQINLRWHPDAFPTLQAGFDPAANADYAARFLVELKNRTGSWALAAGSYHSLTPEKRDHYLKSLRRNVAVANRMYPSLKRLAATEVSAPPPEASSDGEERGTGGFWSAALTQDRGPMSIYATRQLEPILPAFQLSP